MTKKCSVWASNQSTILVKEDDEQQCKYRSIAWLGRTGRPSVVSLAQNQKKISMDTPVSNDADTLTTVSAHRNLQKDNRLSIDSLSGHRTDCPTSERCSADIKKKSQA